MPNDPTLIAIGKQTAEDLELVIACAYSYAGEIGYGDPKYATELYEACARLQPETYLPNGRLRADTDLSGRKDPGEGGPGKPALPTRGLPSGNPNRIGRW